MKMFRANGNVLYAADDALEGSKYNHSTIQSFIEGHINSFLKFYHDTTYLKEKFRIFLEIYSKITDLSNHAMLFAHGSSTRHLFKKNYWQYSDDGTQRPIQEWIDAHDGKYLCLFIWCCNGANFRPRTKRSLLIFSDGILSPTLLKNKATKTVVFEPLTGKEITDKNINDLLLATIDFLSKNGRLSMKSVTLDEPAFNEDVVREEGYNVTIDPEPSIEDLIELGNYDFNDWALVCYLPTQKIWSGNVSLRLLSFGGVLNSSHWPNSQQWINAELTRRGLRHATSRELLVLGKEYPNLPPKGYEIYALGSTQYVCNLRAVNYLRRLDNGDRHFLSSQLTEDASFPNEALILAAPM
ncbi:MAG: hypothetical protein HYT03_02065 [Candidatus Harrisonbacteria bacterium]|nr:hypothetical protein [Candidatus Harrisonbacteria bacterium]